MQLANDPTQSQFWQDNQFNAGIIAVNNKDDLNLLNQLQTSRKLTLILVNHFNFDESNWQDHITYKAKLNKPYRLNTFVTQLNSLSNTITPSEPIKLNHQPSKMSNDVIQNTHILAG